MSENINHTIEEVLETVKKSNRSIMKLKKAIIA